MRLPAVDADGVIEGVETLRGQLPMRRNVVVTALEEVEGEVLSIRRVTPDLTVVVEPDPDLDPVPGDGRSRRVVVDVPRDERVRRKRPAGVLGNDLAELA